MYVITDLDTGGAERQMALLVEHLQARSQSCYVFTLLSNGSVRDHFIELAVPVHSGGLKKKDFVRAPWRIICAQLKLMRVVQRQRPGVVHAFLPLTTFMGALAGRMTRVPVVVTSRRALGMHQERHFLLRPLDLLANMLSHRVTVISKAVWKDTIDRDRIDASKLVLIHNGIDPERFEEADLQREAVRKEMRIKPLEKAIIVVANLIPYKGHSFLLEAAQEVFKHISQAVFLLVGEDRGIGRDLKKMAIDLGIAAKMRFLGLRHDVPDLLAASDLSVLPSHEEGFSNVILESMAAGLPVVATRVGGNPEAVVDGVTGWLVPPGNPAAMAEKIIDLLGDPERAKRWGEQGRNRVKQDFSEERMVKGHLKLYEGRD